MFIELTSYTSSLKKLIGGSKTSSFKFADIICMEELLPLYFVLFFVVNDKIYFVQCLFLFIIYIKIEA